MELTTKGLKKFSQDDNFDVDDFNNFNMDKINDLLVVDFTVETEDDMPEPLAKYENQIIKIKFNNKLKQCIKKTDGTFEWKDYGGTGGGGGGGTYAYIAITYPEGEEVTVTFNEEVYAAPDTSGFWLFGCEEDGNYYVKLGSVTQDIPITYQGQIYETYISGQVVNTMPLYLLGNEYTDLTGGWNAISQGSSTHRAIGFQTKNAIAITHYDKAFTVSGVYYKNQNGSQYEVTVRRGIGLATSTNNPTAYAESSQTISGNIGEKRGLDIGCLIPFEDNKIYCYCTEANVPTYSPTKEAKCLYAYGINTSSPQWLKIYACGFVKSDDLSGLSLYGSTVAEILNKSTEVFESVKALKYIASVCTGEFMITALFNTKFRNAYSASANKTILQGNEVWAEYLPLISY